MLDNIFSRFELFPYSFSRLAKKKKKRFDNDFSNDLMHMMSMSMDFICLDLQLKFF